MSSFTTLDLEGTPAKQTRLVRGNPQAEFNKGDLAMLTDLTRDEDGEGCGLLVEIENAVFGGRKWTYTVVGCGGRYGKRCYLKSISEGDLRKPKCRIGQEVLIHHGGNEHFGPVTGIEVRGHKFYYNVAVHLTDVEAEDIHAFGGK